MKYFVDTNIFLRTFIKEDQRLFTECYQFLAAVKTKKIEGVTAGIVLAEIVWTLRSYYQFPKKQAVTALQSIINLRGLKIVDNYSYPTIIEYYRARTVKYIDCVIASINELHEGKWLIVSYDEEFNKLGIKRKEPREVLSTL